MKRMRQRGAALLTAMVIVTLIATLTVGMVWQQWRAVQVEAAERTQVQARWILDGALDWSRIMLGADSLDIDHLGEPWAVELKEARLSTFLAADKNNTDDGPEAFLSGAIRDAQSRYNLLNLVRDNQYQPTEEAALRRLCELAGVGNLVAQRLIDAMRQAHPGLPTAGAQNQGATQATQQQPAATPPLAVTAPLIPQKLSQLTWLGLDERTIARLAPFLVILPKATDLNLNTAPKEVIAAVVPGADLSGAQRLVQARVRTPLKKVDDALTLLGLKELGGAKLSVKSSYFEVEGSLRLEHLIVAQRSLVERSNAGARNVFIRRSERILGGPPAITLQQ